MELLQIIIQRGIFNKSPPLLFYLIHGNTKKQPSVIEAEQIINAHPEYMLHMMNMYSDLKNKVKAA